MTTEFAIVDLFAGPGGLTEGFSSIRAADGSRPFQIALSVEKEASAFETLRFRSFFRQFNGSAPADYYRFLNGEIPEPDWKSLFPREWDRACLETIQLELGTPTATQEMDTCCTNHPEPWRQRNSDRWASLPSLFSRWKGAQQGH